MMFSQLWLCEYIWKSSRSLLTLIIPEWKFVARNLATKVSTTLNLPFLDNICLSTPSLVSLPQLVVTNTQQLYWALKRAVIVYIRIASGKYLGYRFAEIPQSPQRKTLGLIDNTIFLWQGLIPRGGGGVYKIKAVYRGWKCIIPSYVLIHSHWYWYR